MAGQRTRTVTGTDIVSRRRALLLLVLLVLLLSLSFLWLFLFPHCCLCCAVLSLSLVWLLLLPHCCTLLAQVAPLTGLKFALFEPLFGYFTLNPDKSLYR